MKHNERFNPYLKFFGLFIPNSIAMVPIDVMNDPAKLLLGRLMQFAGTDGKAYPTITTLSIELGWSVSKVSRNIKVLKALKLIEVERLDIGNHQSPNVYYFLYSELYDYEPPVKIDKGVVSDMKNNKSITFSKEKKEKDYNGLYCSVCKERQFNTPSGVTCKNGHGGVDGIKTEKKTPKKKTPKKKKVVLKKKKKTQPVIKKEIPPAQEEKPILKNLKRIKTGKELNPFDYPKDVFKVIRHWEKCGGKVYKQAGAKGIRNTEYIIEELFLPCKKLNSYNGMYPDFSLKAWTVDEIIKSIDVYTKILRKDVSDVYFNEFVVFKQNRRSRKSVTKNDYSTLIECFMKIPEKEEVAETTIKLQTMFNTEFPKAIVYPKSILTIATFLEEKEEAYKINGSTMTDKILRPFLLYMKTQVEITGSYECIKYMANPVNLNKFWDGMIKSYRAKKRTPKEKEAYLIEKPIMAKKIKQAKLDNEAKQRKRV